MVCTGEDTIKAMVQDCVQYMLLSEALSVMVSCVCCIYRFEGWMAHAFWTPRKGSLAQTWRAIGATLLLVEPSCGTGLSILKLWVYTIQSWQFENGNNVLNPPSMNQWLLHLWHTCQCDTLYPRRLLTVPQVAPTLYFR
jgi:hypothetical protein